MAHSPIYFLENCAIIEVVSLWISIWVASMSDIIPYAPSIPSAIKERIPKPVSKRKLATNLAKVGKRTRFVPLSGKRQSYERILAEMVWEAIATRTITFLDGSTVEIDKPEVWLDFVKFIHAHLDGPITVESMNFTEVNVFKVYAGIDIDKV